MLLFIVIRYMMEIEAVSMIETIKDLSTTYTSGMVEHI